MSASNPAVRPTPASGTRGMHSQATSELSLRADSAPPRVASGTTAVRAIAAIPIASAEHKASSSEDLAFLDRLAINHAQGALSRVVSQLLMLRDVTDLAPPPRKEATPSGREQTTEPNVKPAAITVHWRHARLAEENSQTRALQSPERTPPLEGAIRRRQLSGGAA